MGGITVQLKYGIPGDKSVQTRQEGSHSISVECKDIQLAEIHRQMCVVHGAACLLKKTMLDCLCIFYMSRR